MNIIQAVNVQPQNPQTHVDVTFVEYSIIASFLVGSALIIGFFIKSAFAQLSQSNKELKESIEKLANVANSIHNDLSNFKLEVAEKYVAKSDLDTICELRHKKDNS